MSATVPDHELAAPLLQLCRRAGAVILQHYHSDSAGQHTVKADASPLTAADLAAHTLLEEGLEALGLPVLSEESAADVQQHRRFDWPSYWLVDPLDGTREFLGRTDEFTVNVALIENHQVVLGAVAVPVRKQLFFGACGKGAWLWQNDQWQRLRARALDSARPLVAMTSRNHSNRALEQYLKNIESSGFEVQRGRAGSALKFCQLAAGEADVYPRFSPCCEWDTAAGQGVLEAAGGAVLGEDGKPLHYNLRDTLLSQHFVAVADPTQPLWQRLSDRQSADPGID